MKKVFVSAAALALVAGSAFAQNGTVNFRIRELTGQSSITGAADAVLDFVVEANVTGAAGRGLGDWNFDIRINGEAESNGTLARLRINGGDGSLFTGAPSTSTTGGGVAGIATQYRYLVGLNAAFNGVINTSSGTFTNNTAVQEIGLVTGSARGATLANSGIIVDDGGGNLVPATGQAFTDALNGFFGGDGNFVQIYRFRYTVSNLAARDLVFQLVNPTASTFANLVPAGTDWSANTAGGAAQTSAASTTVQIVPAPASAALLGLGGLVVARRRR